MPTPFIIGADEIAKLVELKELAEANPVDMAVLMPRLKNPRHKKQHMRRMNDQTVMLPFGYMVTFSTEINHPNGRAARHMSMSSPNEDRVPNQYAVWMVAEHLGFTGPHSDIDRAEDNLIACDAVWMEDLKGHGKAVNVVQLITQA
jgi:hypothetical protein